MKGLTTQQLDTPYRPDGWTIRQVTHHVPESHMNAYIRFKLALTEDEPTIKPYTEDRWAQLTDTETTPPEVSLSAARHPAHSLGPHLRSIKPDEWKRTFRHPQLGVVRLEKNVALYAWHGRHHMAHITELREEAGGRRVFPNRFPKAHKVRRANQRSIKAPGEALAYLIPIFHTR